MISLPEYINRVRANVTTYGQDPNIIFNSSASSAVIACYNVAITYMNIRKIKNPPVPSYIVTKKTETGETYACFKFASSDVNLISLNKAVQSLCLPNVQITEFSTTVNLEIYI